MKALRFSTPIRNRRRNIHEHLESHFADHLGRLAEVAALAGVGFGKEVLDEAQADVVAHAVELGIDGGIVGFAGGVRHGEVAAELGDDGAVGESDDLGVDFVDAGSWIAG